MVRYLVYELIITISMQSVKNYFNICKRLTLVVNCTEQLQMDRQA
ncbi:hypothetical protein CPT_Solent_018 [Salmonella phage Solent]|nr:hypothetical protein CPT_Solent_018 [Salmonella phage Solent]